MQHVWPALSDETRNFIRDRYRDFCFRPNIFETNTETFFETKCFFCLGTQPSQFIEVLNSGILHPYQHVKHKINLTIRPGITWAFLKFLYLVDTDSWRHFLHQLVRFSLAFPLDSFSRTARTRSTFSADNYRRWEILELPISINYVSQ